MNELIKISYDKDTPTVSGRELHEFLEVGTEYAKWFERMCEYGFSGETDFSSFLTESTGGRPATDHQLTIPMAKEIAMLQRNDKGKQARQYFIKLEEVWNTPEMVISRALKMADVRIKLLQSDNAALAQAMQEQRPKVLFADAVETAQTSILIGDLAKLIKQNGVDIGQNRLFDQLRGDGFLCGRLGDQYNAPTQRSMDMGLFEVRERTINNPDGSVRITRTTKVTGKGQVYFINRYCGKRDVPA